MHVETSRRDPKDDLIPYRGHVIEVAHQGPQMFFAFCCRDGNIEGRSMIGTVRGRSRRAVLANAKEAMNVVIAMLGGGSRLVVGRCERV